MRPDNLDAARKWIEESGPVTPAEVAAYLRAYFGDDGRLSLDSTEIATALIRTGRVRLAFPDDARAKRLPDWPMLVADGPQDSSRQPETLDAALAWLNAMGHFGRVLFWVESIEVMACGHSATVTVDDDGDIPAAIVAAVQEVWDQVNGKGNDG